MNTCSIVGRICRDPELKYTPSGVPVCNFTVAVDRFSKDAQGNREADFIPCVAFKQPAEFLAQYAVKGDRIGVAGRIQVRKWQTQQGENRWSTEVIANNVESYAPKRDSGEQAPAHDPDADDPFGE